MRFKGILRKYCVLLTYCKRVTLAKGSNRVHWKIFYEDKSGVDYKREIYADNLVAQTFLEPVKGKGNKVYSSEMWKFVPHAINSLLLNCKRGRGKYPVGVSFDKGK